VTAIVRDPTRLAVQPHRKLEVVRANVMDPDDIEPVVAGRDAVVSSIGPREKGAHTVCQDSARSIITAMDKANVRRLLVVSASGPFTEGDGPLTRLVVKPMVKRALSHAFADFLAMERRVRDSGLDWTIARPPMLTNGAHTGKYRTAVDRNVRGGNRVSRADLADLIMRVLDDPSTVDTAVSVGY
jgi:putative NADH-flavin reductase